MTSLLVGALCAQAQLQTGQGDPSALVRTILLCPQIQVSNLKFTGDNSMLGSFNSTKANVGLKAGIMLSSGDIKNAVGPNNTKSSGMSMGLPGDGDLDAISSPTHDAAVLEFDFVAVTDSVVINYVFASEEYLEFVNSGFNDVFGFFISGPGISGPYSNNSKNIALTPGTSTPTSVNTINNIKNSNLYIDNGTGDPGTPQFTNNQVIQFDGFTRPLAAKCAVTPGLKYHMKIAIADVSDGIYDSAVFLEGGSFFSNEFSVHEIGTNPFDQLYEGCDSVVVDIKMSSSKKNIGKLPLILQGSAINGIDFTKLPDSIVVKPNGTASFVVRPLKDNLGDNNEFLDIIMKNSACGNDTLHYVFKDLLPITVANYDTVFCGGTIDITAKYAGGASPVLTWTANGSNQNTITVNPGWNSTNYFFTVNDHCHQGPVQGKVRAVVNNKKPNAGKDMRYCSGPAVLIGDLANAGYSYKWSPIAGLNNSAISQPSLTLTNNSGTKSVVNYVVETDNGMCKAKDTIVVTVLPNPVASIDSLSYNKCPIFYHTPKDISSVADSVSYVWSTSDGQEKAGKNSVLAFANTGSYDVYLKVTNYGMCSDMDTAINHVTILPTPIADFTVSNDEVDMLEPTVVFQGNPLFADTCHMDVFDPKGTLLFASPECSFTYDFPTTGYNKVVQYVTAANGCSDTLAKTIYVKPEYFVYAPNAFTMNGDGVNENFQISYSWAIEDFDFFVFDRWGHEMYHQKGSESNVVWDGKAADGTMQPEGVYVYMYTYTRPLRGNMSEKVQEFGKVTLIR
ncbi:MAG: choice-of-anchor L domain-containing protein [Bacteroidetes bacterium]|nr:choice-of-anchor L domain-containing protein [Bacteroidota bacterium]